MTKMMARRLPHAFPTLLLTVLVVIGGSFFWSVYESVGFLVPPLIGALIIAIGVSQLCDAARLTTGESIPLQLVIAALSLPGLLRLSRAKHSLPTPSALSQLLEALVDGPARLLTSPLPARTGQELLVVPVVSAWVGLIVGWVFVRQRRAGWSLTGPFLTLTIALAFGPVRGPFLGWVTVSFLLTALLYVALFGRQYARSQRQSTAEGARVTRRPTMAVPIVVSIAAVAGLVGPHLPGLGRDDRFTLRQFRTPPFQPADLPSPLAEFAKYQRYGDRVLFTATGARPERWRLATLTSYDGRVWSVGRPSDPDGGQFHLIGARLAASSIARGAPAARTTVTLVGLREPWLPMPGIGRRIEFDPSQDQLRSSARYNDESQTLVAPPGSANAATYTVDWAAQVRPTIAQKQAASFGSPPSEMPPSPSLDRVIAPKATEVTSTAPSSWAAVTSLQALLNGGYFSAQTAPGHAYGNLAAMLASPESMVGNDEHYAALFGVLARAIRIPARVVVGFRPQTPVNQSGEQKILGSDVRAWVEVDLGSLGWVPVDVVQDKTKQPKPRQAQPKVSAQPTPTPPNVAPIPEPQASTLEPQRRTSRAEPTASARGRWVFVGGLSLIVLPLVVLTVVPLIVSVLKDLRRRRRRRRPNVTDSIAGAWAELVDRSREVGIELPVTGTLAELTDALPFISDRQRLHLDRLLAASRRAAFHPSPPTAELKDEIWREVDEVTSWFVADKSRTRRLQVLANPRSLFRSFSL
jgi:transglutaminase-like putative cysteine protease